MEGQPPVAVERPGRWSQWFARLSFAQTRRVALLLILVATAAFGGLDTVDKQVTPFKPGEEFSDGEYTVTIERARLVDELKGTQRLHRNRASCTSVWSPRSATTAPCRGDSAISWICGMYPDKEFFGAFRFRDGSSDPDTRSRTHRAVGVRLGRSLKRLRSLFRRSRSAYGRRSSHS